MRKESWILAFLKFAVSCAILFFLVMLYWSSALVESDLQSIKGELKDLQYKISQGVASQPQAIQMAQPEIEDNPKNILKPDPFYLKTLPELLGAGFKPHGTFQDASLGKPSSLHPFSNWGQVNEWLGNCGLAVARGQFGIYETYAPYLGTSMEETGPGEYLIKLRKDAFWQPLKQAWFSSDVKLDEHFLKKHPVTAHDLKFYMDALLNPYNQEAGATALRDYYEDVEEVTVLDDYTLKVRWKLRNGKAKYISKPWTSAIKPFPRFVYQYFPDGKKIIDTDDYRTNSVWAQNLSQHWAKNIIVSCGPWIFDGMTERAIRFVRNADHFNPNDALADAMEVQLKDSADNLWQEFRIQNTDRYIINPEQLLELDQFMQSPLYKDQVPIEKLNYISSSYFYLGWNEVRPFFSNPKLRRAMTMAINRKRIIQQNLNGLGLEVTGPINRFSPNYNTSIQPWPYDPDQARKMLAEEGWYDTDGDGILDKDGTPFSFTLNYFVKNNTTKSICEYISTALKEIGIQCILNGLDMADLTHNIEDKNFDAVFMGWSQGSPPENLRQLWHSSGAKEKGSSNFIGFANAEVDRIIDELDFEYDLQKRAALYHQFLQIIHDEAPYTFLYTPKVTLLYRQYLQNVFIPMERQDLIPGANVSEPDPGIFWLKKDK